MHRLQAWLPCQGFRIRYDISCFCALSALRVCLRSLMQKDSQNAACREHCGSHEYIWEIITTTQEPNGKLTLQSVYEELKDQIDPFMAEPTVIKVVFQCSRGKRRSVACAEITSEMLRTRGLCDNPPHRLSQWYWSKYKCGRRHCHCMEITRKKRCAIETARACWEAVFGELPAYNM